MYKDVLIAGYSDRLSVRPGETIRFAVSSLANTNYQATLFRSISSDPNPKGPGIVELNADEYFKPVELPSRHQSINPGSYGETTKPLLRSGAKVGDSLYVSSLPGLSAAGLFLLNSGKEIGTALAQKAIVQHKAPTIEYQKYRDCFSKLNCAIDVSDGLASDAAHLAKASNVRIDLNEEILSRSELKELDAENYLGWVLNGGEDHVLLGTSKEVVPGFIEIGKVLEGSGVALDGKEITAGGYTHSWN